MRLFKTRRFNEITAYELGWSFIGSPLMTVYCYVFGDVMIDTAQSHMQREALRIVSRHDTRNVYLTHYHEDHSGNAGAFQKTGDMHIYGHALTKEIMAEPFKIFPYQKYIWGKATALDIEPLPERVETPLGEMEPVHTPGHSKDHTAYFLQDEGILFTGDLYLGDRIKYFRSDEDAVTQIESLKKVLSLDFDMLLCSHAPKKKQGKKHIRRKLDFLENLYGDILLLREKGLSEKQIFRSLKLKENYMAKLICFGDVSMMNGVRSMVRHR